MSDDAIHRFVDETGLREANTVEVARTLAEDGKNVKLTFVRDVTPPVRLESPPRAHTFWAIEGFVKYLEKYGTERTVILGDPENGRISAVLDEQAERGFEIIQYLPKVHPLWKPWQDLLDRKWPNDDEVDRHGNMKIKAFGKFLVGQRSLIVAPDAGELIVTFSQIRQTKNVTMQSGFGIDTVNGVMVEAKLEGGKVRETPLKIPEAITVDCPMYVNRPNADIVVDLIVDAADTQLVVELRSGDAEAKRVQAIKEMLEEVSLQMPGAVVALGSVSHKAWEYVKAERP